MSLKKIWILLLFLLPGLTGNVWAQKVAAFAKADTNAIMIGDQIGLHLGIELPKNFEVVWPVFGDTLNAHVEIVKRTPVDTVYKDESKVISQQLIITSFDSGYYHLPAVTFKFHKKNDTTVYSIDTDPIGISVFAPQVDTTKAFKPVKAPLAEPVTLGEILPWVGGGLLLIAVIVFIIYYLERRKAQKPVFARKPKPLPPPDVEAITRLEELRLAKLWQSGKVKEYHSAITDIMRNYLMRRFDFDAPEMTTAEILEVLKSKPVNEQAYGKLKRVFELADLVKFAKLQPAALENDQSIYDSIDFVNETKAVPVQESSETETPAVEPEKTEEESK